MARDKGTIVNIDKSNLSDYPNGRIKNNTGGNDGTPVNEFIYGDLHETKDKLMRLYGISYNGLPDNETNGYQFIQSLIALASKNDFTINLNISGDSLSVDLKLGKLLDNETFILKSSINKGVQTTIKGSDNVVKIITYLGEFKANEYVRMINTNSSVILVRMIDSNNIGAAIDELNYLKKASQAEEDAGVIDNKATTPLTNKTSFIKRVNGEDSSDYLAIATGSGQKNGLLSHQDKKKINDFTDPLSGIVWQSNNVSTNSRSIGHNSNNYNFNYYDVYPPSGKTMANLKCFIPSISEIWFSGVVDSNDEFWCNYEIRSGYIRVICNSSENRQVSKINYLAIWI